MSAPVTSVAEAHRGTPVTSAPVPFPIPYQGSKRKLAPAILSACFPDDVGVLHEPFCGSGAVTLAALATGRARQARLNDANEPLIRLWDEIVDSPDALARGYDDLWHLQAGRERAFYDEVRDRFNRRHEPHDLLFLLARCVKAAVRYNRRGDFNQSPDNRRRGTRPARMADHISRASAILGGRALTSARDCRAALAEATADDLVYLDPPYQGVSASRDRRYQDGLELERFVAVLDDLNGRGISYILSYDGRTGDRTHGRMLPEGLHLEHRTIDAGRSSQATLLGRDDRTIESLHLSPALVDRLGGPARARRQGPHETVA